MTTSFPSASRVLIRNATIPGPLTRAQAGHSPFDLLIEHGTIARVSPAGSPNVDGAVEFDLEGGLVLPAFADIHTHIDKGHIWPRRPNPDGTWLSALLSVSADRTKLWKSEDVERRMEFSLRCAYAHGTAAIRTHLNSIPPQHDISWALFERMRERWADRIELQAVSLVSPDALVDPSTLDVV